MYEEDFRGQTRGALSQNIYCTRSEKSVFGPCLPVLSFLDKTAANFKNPGMVGSPDNLVHLVLEISRSIYITKQGYRLLRALPPERYNDCRKCSSVQNTKRNCLHATGNGHCTVVEQLCSKVTKWRLKMFELLPYATGWNLQIRYLLSSFHTYVRQRASFNDKTSPASLLIRWHNLGTKEGWAAVIKLQWRDFVLALWKRVKSLGNLF